MKFGDIFFGALALIIGGIALYSGFTFVGILFLGTLAAIIIYTLIFKSVNTEKLIAANEESGLNKNVYVKKYDEANIEKFKLPILLTGLLISSAFTFMAFNWAEELEEVVAMDMGEFEDDTEILPPQTIQRPPPPPPPPPPPKLEVVEDEEIIEEEEIEIQETEADEETEIEVPEIIEEPGEVEIEVEEEPEEPEIFMIVEEQAKFPGGDLELMKFVGKKIKYPAIARENNIEGRVIVKFVVNEDGSISQAQVLRDIGGGCGDEALRVIKMMPKWEPGKQRGKAVKVWFTMPVQFKLE